MSSITTRPAVLQDKSALLDIEQQCFASDRLSKRSFRHWIQAEHGVLLVAETDNAICGYGLVWCHQGTRLARVYSLAVAPQHQGRGIARLLLQRLEEACVDRGHFFLRLEVSKSNRAAIALYQQLNYRVFGEYSHYYEDQSDALRMQKNIARPRGKKIQRETPWYQQTTDFTCGPASLMMAMASLDSDFILTQNLELDLWREATTIFMTSGHGGCHPIGLALAAKQRGFAAEVFVNTEQVPFLDSVRSPHKKAIMELVHQQFTDHALEQQVAVNYRDIGQTEVAEYLERGCAVLVLISTYRLDGKKVPHWVAVTAVDEHCFYVHDPDPDDTWQAAIDCQYLPIAREDFDRMSVFGSGRLRTAVIVFPLNQP